MTEEQDEIENAMASEAEGDVPDSVAYEINSYPADITLQGYYDKWKATPKQLLIPDFQREYVWDINRASKLIESFLLGLPVPGVFLYQERKKKNLLVIDGQQRILSAIRYFENDFDGRPFRLKGVSKRFAGKSFNQLSEAEQNQLRDIALRATIVQQLDPQDDSSIYHIFERLNTGGISLSSMEVRKCVYFGRFLDLLMELNDNKIWQEKILGRKKPDKRLRDVELVLRCLAMKEQGAEYKKPMKEFLNEYLVGKNKEAEPRINESIDWARGWFSLVCEHAVELLGDKPFHLRGKLNLAVMDTVMPLIDKMAKQNTSEARQRYELLQLDPQFLEDTSKDTSDTVVVLRRMPKAKRYLLEAKLSDLV